MQVSKRFMGAVRHFRRNNKPCFCFFWNNAHGGVLVEVAIMAPIIIVLLLGLVEFTNGFLVHRNLHTLSATIADLTSRETELTPGDLEKIATHSELVLAPFNRAPLKIIVSSVTGNNRGEAIVDWSFAFGNSVTQYGQGTEIPVPGDLAQVGEGLVMVEAMYNYAPGFGAFLVGQTITLTSVAFQVPRSSNCVVIIIEDSVSRGDDHQRSSNCVVQSDADRGDVE